MNLFVKCLLAFLLSMVPVVELRGAMLYWIPAGIPVLLCYLICVVGNLVPIPFLIVFTKKVFAWLKTKGKIGALVDKLEAKAHAKSEIVQKYEWWGLCILVAIPLPGTGAWTGALVAAVLGMRLKKALPAIAVGVMIAGLIMILPSFGIKLLV